MWNRPAVGGQGTGIARVATGPDRLSAAPVQTGDRRSPVHTAPRLPPGEQDRTGKTGHPDRHRDLPDLIRRTGSGLPRAGHGVSGHGDIRRGRARARGHPAAAARSPDCGQDRSASRRAKVFLPLAMPGFLRLFFNRRYSANSGADPPAVSPRVSGGHFVSDDPLERFYAMITTGWRRRKSETKRNAKKQPRRSREVRRMTPTRRPRREGPVISEQPERLPGAANMPLASRSRRFFVASFGGQP